MTTETRNQAERVFAAAGGAGPYQFNGDAPGDAPRPLHQIAFDIRMHWPKVNYAAQPYLDAMRDLDKITDMYMFDTGRSIVTYFLSNATSWRGEDARRIKAELKAL